MDQTQSPHYLSETELAALSRSLRVEEDADWQRFLQHTEELRVDTGDVLIRQFDQDRDVYILTSGQLEIRVGDAPDDPGMVIATVSPFAILGEQSFLDEGVRSASVVAAGPATVYRLTFDAFERLCAEAPDLAIAFLFDIARSLSLRDRVNQIEA